MKIKRLRNEEHLKESLGDSVLWIKFSYDAYFQSFHTNVLCPGTWLG